MTLTQGAVPQWRDISTAPKDGTEFQAWWSGQWHPVARINPETEAFEIWGRVDYDMDGWEPFSTGPDTKWMPHPTGPEQP